MNKTYNKAPEGKAASPPLGLVVMRHTEMSELGYIGASAIAAAIPSCLVLSLALFGLATQHLWGTAAAAELDDAPMRVVGIGLVLSLSMFLFHFVMFYLSARLLASIQWLSFGSLASASIASVSIALYWKTLGFRGLRLPDPEETRSFFVFWFAFGSFTLLSTYIWWRVAHNRWFQRTASHPIGRR